VAELVVQVPATVLAVYAHPDDADVAAGGTLARWARAGAAVHVVICTDGGRGTVDAAILEAEFALTRAAELAAAAGVLGLASHRSLGWADGEVENTVGLRGTLVGLIRELRPDAVLGHDPTAVFFGQHYFNHHDHRALGWALLDALSPASGLPHYFSDRGPAHTVSVAYLSGTLEPDVWVDISDTIEDKVAAVGCHRSQLAGSGTWATEAVRERALAEGRRAQVRYAEGFRRLDLGG
jgi:LmbE family N-acetylglucosaminyl deacetylase